RTPPLSDSILAGVTRDTILTMLRDTGAAVSEEPISIEELFDAHAAGELDEVWGTGTAAIVSPIGRIAYKGREILVHDGQRGPTTEWLYNGLLAVQKGRDDDPRGWRVAVLKFD